MCPPMATALVNFNPRPPRGGRLRPRLSRDDTPYISIHAPREGGDWHHGPPLIGQVQFQSTPPARGATRSAGAARSERSISIHAPREGGDLG